MGKKGRNKTNPDEKRSLTRVSIIPSSDNNNNPSPEHPPKKQKLTVNTITPPPEPPSTTTAATTITSSDLRKLIQHLTHSQLIELLTNASLNHPDVLDAVRSLADRDITQRKLHVRGLGLKTRCGSLRSVFAPFGELKQVKLNKHKATRKSKGCGLVIYKHVDSALLALKEPSKVIDGRMTFSMLAKDGFTRVENANGRRVYVENVTSGMSAAKLLEFFQEYGEVEEGPVGFDKTTGQFKGFAIIFYKNVDGAKACLVDPVKCVDGRELRCRLANDKKVKPGGVDALVTADTQGDVVKLKVVGSDQQSLMQGTFGSSGVTASGGNSCGLVGPGGIQGYGGGGQGMSLSALVQGSGDGVRPEVVNSNLQSSMQGSFASQFGNGGPSVGSSYGGNSGGLGLQEGPGGSFGYGVLGKGPLLGHSINASLNHPDILDDVRILADRDITQRKLHVRGLGLKTTSASLRSVFAPFGELEQAMVIKDKATRKSKCHGFVIYKHVDSALLALKEPSKVIDGRMSFSMLAKDSASVIADNANGRRVYVENVTSGVSAEKLLECFQGYGEVEEGPVGFDKTTGEFKGFAFIIYKNVDGAKACLVDPVKCVDGCQLRCRLANDKKVKPGGVDAIVTADTQGDVVKLKVVGSDQQSLMQGTFGSSGVAASGGNSCGLVGPGGIQGGGGGQGMSLSAQVQGSGDGVRPEVVNSNQQSSMQGSFASEFGNGGPSVGSSYGGNSGGLGLQEGSGGSFGYGILGKGPPLGHSQHPLNLSSGGGSVMSSFGSSVGGMGLSTSGGLQPSSLRVDGGGFSGDSHLSGPGASYGGKGSGREAGLGLGFRPFGVRGSSYGGTESGGGTGLLTHGSQAPSSLGGDNGGRYGGSHFGSSGLSYGGTGSGGGVELGTRVGGAGPSYGGIGSGFGGSDASFVRQSSGGEVGLSGSLGGPSASYGVSGSGRGVGLGSGFEGLGSSYGGPVNGGEAGLGAGFNEPGARYGMGNGDGVGLGSGLGPLGERSRYGLSPGSVRKSSGGAHYSLSSGSADQTQLQQKKYQGARYKL